MSGLGTSVQRHSLLPDSYRSRKPWSSPVKRAVSDAWAVTLDACASLQRPRQFCSSTWGHQTPILPATYDITWPSSWGIITSSGCREVGGGSLLGSDR